MPSAHAAVVSALSTGIYIESGVTISGRIITAQGPRYAKEFGEAIAKTLAQIKVID